MSGVCDRKVESDKPVERYGSTSYVSSVGTCNGDSGGPVFIREGSHFVLTGDEAGAGHVSRSGERGPGHPGRVWGHQQPHPLRQVGRTLP